MLNLLGSRYVLWLGAGLVAAFFIFNAGRTFEKGHQADRIARMGNNYIQLTINEKVAHWNEMGYERQRAREMIETAEAAISASASARAASQRQIREYRARMEAAENQSTEVLNRLEEMRDKWAENRVPNEYVCGIYRGVRDIPGCPVSDTSAGEPVADGDL